MPGVLNLIRAGGASTEIHFGHRVAGAMSGVLNLIRASRVLILNLINPQSPHAGVDARAPRMHVVQSFCTSL
jgi:hypothetical protein